MCLCVEESGERDRAKGERENETLLNLTWSYLYTEVAFLTFYLILKYS